MIDLTLLSLSASTLSAKTPLEEVRVALVKRSPLLFFLRPKRNTSTHALRKINIRRTVSMSVSLKLLEVRILRRTSFES